MLVKHSSAPCTAVHKTSRSLSFSTQFSKEPVHFIFTMSTNSYDEAYDARKYKCPPWFGEAGAQFTQTFSPNFLSALDQIADDFNTLAQHLQQEDFGSPNNPHANAGTAAIQAKSVLAYNLRIVKCISLMRAHVENTELRKVIDFLKANPPAGPGISLAVTIWQRMILEGTLQSSSLNILNQEYDWTNLKLSNVGQNDRSMTALRSVIDTVNGEREDPKTDEIADLNSLNASVLILRCMMQPMLSYLMPQLTTAPSQVILPATP